MAVTGRCEGPRINKTTDLAMSVQLPPKLYRVQHRDSSTYYHEDVGFETHDRYYMAPSHWLNKKKINGHLDLHDRPREERTPFISMYAHSQHCREGFIPLACSRWIEYLDVVCIIHDHHPSSISLVAQPVANQPQHTDLRIVSLGKLEPLCSEEQLN